FGALVLADGVFGLREPRVPIAISDLLVAATLLACWGWLRGHPASPKRAHAWLGVVALPILADILFVMALIPTPDATIFLILFAIGAGGLSLSTPWTAGLLGGAVGAWLPFVVARPQQAWATFGIGFAAALVLSFTFHFIRKRAIERMETLRLTDGRRKAELEIREEALQGAVQAAQESEERYRRLVENAPDACLVHSRGKVVYANAAAARLFGALKSEQLLGMDAFSLVHPDYLPTVMARTALIEAGEVTPRMEMKILRLDGKS